MPQSARAHLNPGLQGEQYSIVFTFPGITNNTTEVLLFPRA